MTETQTATARFGWLGRAVTDLFVETARAADADADERRADPTERNRANRDAMVVLVVAAVILTGSEYFAGAGDTGWLGSTLDAVGLDSAAAWWRRTMNVSPDADLYRHLYWSVAYAVVYIVPSVLVARYCLKRSGRDMGWRLRGTNIHRGLLFLVIAGITPLVIAASFLPEFQAKYPFYEPGAGTGLWPRFVVWELSYALQLLGLEVFFRGFMVHGLSRRLGYLSVFVMTVPYVMIHFGKPLPETIGAIVAGVVLGTHSLRSGTVMWGWTVHVYVAIGMDLLALAHLGRLF